MKPGAWKMLGGLVAEPAMALAPPSPPRELKRGSSAAQLTALAGGFYVGQRVEAKHLGKSKWFGGTVMQVNDGGDATFKICYDGGMWNSWMPVTVPEVRRRRRSCTALQARFKRPHPWLTS